MLYHVGFPGVLLAFLSCFVPPSIDCSVSITTACKARTPGRTPPSSSALLAREANPSLDHPSSLGRIPLASYLPEMSTQPRLDESKVETVSILLSQPLQGGSNKQSKRTSHTRERPKIYRFEGTDFLLLTLSLPISYTMPRVCKKPRGEKKSLKYLDDLPTQGTCRWQQRFIKQATKQDVIKQFESMPS